MTTNQHGADFQSLRLSSKLHDDHSQRKKMDIEEQSNIYSAVAAADDSEVSLRPKQGLRLRVA